MHWWDRTRYHDSMKRICVYCGSKAGDHPVYREAATALGEALVRRDLGLVFGGGRIGLMGAVADAVMAAGGEAIGVIPEALMAVEVGHAGLTELRVVGTMHERKAAMADLADGFIAMPGGFGTMEEFFEMTTWSQLGLNSKPLGLLNTEGYYDALLGFVEHAVAEGFVRPGHRDLIVADEDPDGLINALQSKPAYTETQILTPDQY